MTSHDPSSPEPEEGGQPSFDKQQPPEGPPPSEAAPPRPEPYGGGGPYGTGAPPPYDVRPGSPYDSTRQQPGHGAPAGAPPAGMPPLGSWPNRILARVIDYVIIQVIAFVVVLPFTGFRNSDGYTDGVWVFYGLYLVYEGLMLSRDGQTLGKKAMKVRVAMLADGSSPGNTAGWTRAAVYTLPAVICCGLWWLVNGLFGVFDKPYRQCVHDKAARTVVVSVT
ncbi:RDD family protein [Kitasatospora sp. NPDC052896]|uniref:RDD family protein n=1 Tax=Kitasatospora sp. NPDC052896 TaxID=3364061 RepID=UPI0037CC3AD5